MKFKGRLTAILAAAALTLTCAGCGQGSDETSVAEFTPRLDTEEQVSFKIIGCMANFESLEAVITDFEEYYPNCEVLYEAASSSGEYWETLVPRLKTDDTVGLFMLSANHYTTDAIKEMCVDMSKEDIDLSAIQPEAISASTVDGKLYGVPVMHNASGLIVNKTLLSEQGLEIPENYGELLDVCEKLKQAGFVPLQGYAPMVNDSLTRSMSFVLMNNAFKDNSSQAELDSLVAGEEGSASVLQPVFDTLDTLYKKGYLDNSVNELYEDGYNDAILKFFEGDVPFLAGSTETFSGMKKRETKSEHFSAEPFEYAYMTAPLGEDGAYSYVENWYDFSMNSNSADKEWALEFLRFLTTNEEINKIAYIKGLPSVAVETDDDRFIGLYTENEDYQCTADTFFPQTVQDALYYTELDLTDGKITVDEAASEMERRLREGDFSEE